MSYTVSNGSTFYIGSAYGSDLSVTAATNAAPCVMTSTAHGLANGDFVVVTSNWSRITDKVYRVANVAANTFELEGSDTSDTELYPVGSGTGSVKEVTAWTQITQVVNVTAQRSEQQYATVQPLEGDREIKIPTIKTGGGLDLQVGDDPSLAGFQAALTANNDGVARAIRVVAKNQSKSLFYSYVAADETPEMNQNQVMVCGISLTHLNAGVRYTT